ncbi:hypothetical protein MTW76_01725 [Mammaliicoccus sciuri]|uniref:hypothetical protein n=1 Tax=Mammaliicoccus sciuri TaxID=1296 RepID=UPI001FB4DCB0|nr:hypothetical protein [Mammaliicoccus sciuri]MCJ0933690.1 hypothetical protein [Mammaliicoccus sciuri]
MNKDNQMQANPQMVINYLTQEVAELIRENAMLKAVIQEQNNKDNQAPTQSE